MTTLIAILFDPMRLGMGVIAGALCRQWWHVPLAALAAECVLQIAMEMMRPELGFSPASFIICYAITYACAALAFAIRHRRAKMADGPMTPDT